MSEESTPTVTSRPVLARDSRGPELFGFAMREWGILAVVAAVGIPLFGGLNWASGLLILGTAAWLKKVGRMIPDGMIRNAIDYYKNQDHYYRGAAPDTEWRPPIR